MARPTSRFLTEPSAALVEMRNYLHLTQEQLAQRLRVSSITVSRWETTHPPRGKTLQRLRDFAKRQGATGAVGRFQTQIELEKDAEYRRIRRAQILDAKNLMNIKAHLIMWWSFEMVQGMNAQRREWFLELVDRLWDGGRKEFLGEY
jgi:transcriptional regulator with XRE-family HTH domain